MRLIDLIWNALPLRMDMTIEVIDTEGNIYYVTGVRKGVRTHIIGGHDQQVFVIRVASMAKTERKQ